MLSVAVIGPLSCLQSKLSVGHVDFSSNVSLSYCFDWLLLNTLIEETTLLWAVEWEQVH